MEAKDLMIGDWVCVTKNFAQKYHRIRALSNDKEDVLKGTYINDYGVECNSIFSFNDIEPIPLTTEILEKNGFVRNETWAEWVHYRDNIFIDFAILENETSFHLLPNAVINYVHELQHALRLCGIDKEIEL